MPPSSARNLNASCLLGSSVSLGRSPAAPGPLPFAPCNDTQVAGAPGH
jgi:hypothetical protein